MKKTSEEMDETHCGPGTFLILFILILACNIVSADNSYITPYCDGFLTLSNEAQSLRVRAPSVPVGFGRKSEELKKDICTWYFYAPIDSVIKIEVIDLELRNNESIRVFDGVGEKFGPGNELGSALDQDYVSTKNSISIELKPGKFFEGSAAFQLSLQNRKSIRKFNSHGVLSIEPAMCGGTVTLDSSARVQRFNATNREPGTYPAYCIWNVVAPSSTLVRLNFLSATLEYYDNFMVGDANGARLADFYNIKRAPYDVLSNSNEILCLFAASDVLSSSFVEIEVTYVDVGSNPALDENTVHQLSGGHISLTDSGPSITFQSTNFSGATNVYVGSYWYITSPPGSKIKVDFLNVDTGSNVFLGVSSDTNTPLTSVSGDMDLYPVISLNNFMIIWFSSQWQNPQAGVTIKVSVKDDQIWDSTETMSSCGGSVDLEDTSAAYMTFSSPNYNTDIDQHTICYWYFTSVQDTRVELEFIDIQTENSMVYVFDSVNAPSLTVSFVNGEATLSPFHSSSSGVTVMFNDYSEWGNGRGLLARAKIIDGDTAPLETSCGGQILLDASSPTRVIKSPWYDAPTNVMAYTSCYWYVGCSTERVVSFELLDLQTKDATLEVYDTAATSLKQKVAFLSGDISGTLPFLSSGPGVAVKFSDSPSIDSERGFHGRFSISDSYNWTETTTLTSCGATIAMDASSPPLTFSSPAYTRTQPDGIFDCKWYFSGPNGMDFVLDFADIDVAQTTYVTAFDGSNNRIADLSGKVASTTTVTSHSSFYLNFYDYSTTDMAPGFLAKLTVKDPPTWDETATLDSCGGGIPLDYTTRTFMFTTPDYPATNGAYFNCIWFVRSPSDTTLSVEVIDFETKDSYSELTVYDGTSIYDPELIRLSGSPSNLPSVVEATTNYMVLYFFSDRASSGRGASLIVTFTGGEIPNNDVRLIGGSGPNEGRVELYYENTWGTVCDDNWGEEDAMVVCSMLGYRTVIAFWSRAHFGAGTGPIWLDDLECTGQEKHITDCPHNMPTGTNNCGHAEDAGVTCGEGADVICDGNSMTVFIDRVLLAHGDGALDVHLIDPSCRGYDHDSVHVAVSTSFDRCGTKMQQTDDAITFTNLITYFQPKSINGEKITRDFVLCVPVTCSFNRHVLVGNTYRPQVGLVTFNEVGYQNFSMELAIYEDATFDALMPEGVELPLDEPVYFGINLTAVTDLTLIAQSCWATPNPYPFDHIKYRIIDDGCALDHTLKYYDDVINDPLFTAFSVNAFAFVGEYDQVYMHCEVLVCDNTDPNSRCQQGCISRSRRAAGAEVAGRRGASSHPHTISNGPISPRRARSVGGKSSHNTSSNGDGNMNKMVAIGISGFLLAAGVMIAYVTFARGRRSGNRHRSDTDRENRECGEEKAELLNKENDPNII